MIRLEGPEVQLRALFTVGAYRFFFFSREESRAHVHVHHAQGEAKLWLDPLVEVAENHGLDAVRLNRALRLAREHEDEIRQAWQKHFGG